MFLITDDSCVNATSMTALRYQLDANSDFEEYAGFHFTIDTISGVSYPIKRDLPRVNMKSIEASLQALSNQQPHPTKLRTAIRKGLRDLLGKTIAEVTRTLWFDTAAQMIDVRDLINSNKSFLIITNESQLVGYISNYHL